MYLKVQNYKHSDTSWNIVLDHLSRYFSRAVNNFYFFGRITMQRFYRIKNKTCTKRCLVKFNDLKTLKKLLSIHNAQWTLRAYKRLFSHIFASESRNIEIFNDCHCTKSVTGNIFAWEPRGLRVLPEKIDHRNCWKNWNSLHSESETPRPTIVVYITYIIMFYRSWKKIQT